MLVMESAPGSRTVINGREVDYFCGTGYFGLHGRAELVEAACDAAKKYGTGSATSRQGYGDNPVLLDVESKAARFMNEEAALYFASGYLGSSLLLQGLKDRFDVVFFDEESHYSVRDGVLTLGKTAVPFIHLDAGDLERQVQDHLRPGQIPLIVSDGIFPISGEIAPLPDYLKVMDAVDPAVFCIDDAHAVGVLGANGRGIFEYFGVRGDRLFACGTLSKAMGGFGGIIASDREFIDHLKRDSDVYHGSSPVPTPVAAASARALELVTEQPEMRQKLWSNVARVKEAFRRIGFDIPDNPVPIVCLHRPGLDMKGLQAELLRRDLAVLYVGGKDYSSVPEEGAIRVAVFSTHSEAQIDRLVEEISSLIPSFEKK